MEYLLECIKHFIDIYILVADAFKYLNVPDNTTSKIGT